MMVMPSASSGSHETIAEVLNRLDERPPDPRALYYRWETEQWEAGALSFARDRSSWAALEPDRRASLVASLAGFIEPSGRVGDLLVPFVDAVASEEEQVFLTSQLVDEARAVVFCERFRTEVLEAEGAAAERMHPNDGVSRLLGLAEPRADAVRIERKPGTALYEGLLILSVVRAGVIAPTFQRRLGTWLEDQAGFPDLTVGIRFLAHDAARHTQFAVRLLQQALGDDARTETTDSAGIEALVEEAIPAVREVVDAAARVSNDFSGLPYDERELTSDMMDCIALRVQDIGLDLPT